jgi:hypothetical protein
MATLKSLRFQLRNWWSNRKKPAREPNHAYDRIIEATKQNIFNSSPIDTGTLGEFRGGADNGRS